MLVVETIAKIRRAHFVDGRPIKDQGDLSANNPIASGTGPGAASYRNPGARSSRYAVATSPEPATDRVPTNPKAGNQEIKAVRPGKASLKFDRSPHPALSPLLLAACVGGTDQMNA